MEIHLYWERSINFYARLYWMLIPHNYRHSDDILKSDTPGAPKQANIWLYLSEHGLLYNETRKKHCNFEILSAAVRLVWDVTIPFIKLFQFIAIDITNW